MQVLTIENLETLKSELEVSVKNEKLPLAVRLGMHDMLIATLKVQAALMEATIKWIVNAPITA